MRSAQGRHWMRVIPFARSTRDLGKSEEQQPWTLRLTAGEAGRATDLEAAVREAIASLPAGMVPRVALISDGKENKGSIARAAWQAQQLGIPIDTFALAGRPEPALRSGIRQLAVDRIHRRTVPHRRGGLGARRRVPRKSNWPPKDARWARPQVPLAGRRQSRAAARRV